MCVPRPEPGNESANPWNITMNNGVTPRQLKLVGLLVVLLIGVVAFRMQPTAKASSGSQPVASETSNDAAPTANPATGAEQVADDVPSIIPSVSLAQLWTSNPFRGMTEDPEPPPPPVQQPDERSASERLLEELTGQNFGDDHADETADARPLEPPEMRVSAILDNGLQRSALVGNAVVRVGDELDGYEVVAIHADGIELAQLAAQSIQSSKSADSGHSLQD